MENLDMKCAERGQKLAAKKDVDEKLLTDILGVLEEQGLYAAFLFAKVRGGDGGESVGQEILCFLKKTPKGSPFVGSEEEGDILNAIKQVSKEPDNLLLARDLVRTALVYARYHARAR